MYPQSLLPGGQHWEAALRKHRVTLAEIKGLSKYDRQASELRVMIVMAQLAIHGLHVLKQRPGGYRGAVLFQKE
jgi:hypothetical protein